MFSLATRTYDSIKMGKGFFGQGWSSVFDAYVIETRNNYTKVVKENGVSVLFAKSGSSYVQAWPTNGSIGSLSFDGTYYLYTNPARDVVRVYETTGANFHFSRLVEVRLVRTGETVFIDFLNDQPTGIRDGSNRWSWDVTVDPDSGRITEISTAPTGATWVYEYYPNPKEEKLLHQVLVNDMPYRTHTYDVQGRLLTVTDAADHLMLENTYHDDPSDLRHYGWLKSTSTGRQHIEEVEYHVPDADLSPDRPVNASQGEYAVRVRHSSDPEDYTDYYIRPVEGGPQRTAEIRGNCSCPGSGDFALFAYDALGRLVRKQNARGFISRWTYGTGNSLIRIERGLSPPDCDRLTDPYCRILPSGLPVTPDDLAAFDLSSQQPAAIEDITYDGQGRLKTTSFPLFNEDPSPATEEYTYDPSGQILSFRDANHTEANVLYAYDALNRLITTEQLASQLPEEWQQTNYTYDGNGNLSSVTDANGNPTNYFNDDFGQTYKTVSPVTGNSKHSYDATGRLTTRIDANGSVETRSFNNNGLLDEVTFTRGFETETVSFVYQHGLRASATVTHTDTSVGSESWTYDRRGLMLTNERQETGSGAFEPVPVRFEYNEDGNLVKRIRGCEELIYGLDYAGRQVSVSLLPADCSGASSQIASEGSYLPFGPLLSLSGLKVSQSFTYDGRYRMTSQLAAEGAIPLVHRTYGTPGTHNGYDGVNNLLVVADLLEPTRDRSYIYDDLNRLTRARAQTSVGSWDFEYDAIGNRTRKEMGPEGERTIQDYTYVGTTALLDTISITVGSEDPELLDIVHDPTGNLTSDDQSNYTYNPRNQLISQDLLLGFTYDAVGRRVRTRNIGAHSGYTTEHFLLADGKPFFERVIDGLGVVREEHTFIYFNGQLLTIADHEGNLRHVVSDHIGFPLATFDSDSGWQANASPFGEIEQVLGGTQASDPLLRYPGQWQPDPRYYSASSTLYYNGYRWYSPDWGRYTQSDPIGLLGSENLFTYADNSPFVLTDPYGLTPTPGPRTPNPTRTPEPCQAPL